METSVLLNEFLSFNACCGGDSKDVSKDNLPIFITAKSLTPIGLKQVLNLKLNIVRL